MSDKIRCGVLGLGHGHALAKVELLHNSKEWELIGVCEPDEKVRSEYASAPQMKGVKWLTREELLGDATVKMVAVESKTPRLLQLGRAAVEAGKHIHLDKPAGANLNEFRALLDAAASRNLIVQMGYMFRYNAGFDFIRRAVGQGWLGRIFSIQASMCTQVTPQARRDLSFHSGGIMLELGGHMIDMIVLLIGGPKTVTSFLRHDGDEDDRLNDNTLAVLEYDRAMVVVETAAMETEAFSRRRFKSSGTRGTIILTPLETPALQLCLREKVGCLPKGWQTMPVNDIPRYVRDFEELLQCIREGRPLPYTKEHDFEVQKTLLRASGEVV